MPYELNCLSLELDEEVLENRQGEFYKGFHDSIGCEMYKHFYIFACCRVFKIFDQLFMRVYIFYD